MRSPNRTYDFQKDRIVVWFSHGATSAVAAYLVCRDFPRENIRIILCDTASEHPSNKAFMGEMIRLLNHPIETMKNPKYRDIWDVFEKRRFLVGPHGAPCTTELKKSVRQNFEQYDDIQVFGYHIGEKTRAQEFIEENQEVKLYAPLIEHGLSDSDCKGWLMDRGIQLPAMYLPQKSGAAYNHNNCIGCVKGGMGHWNKIRIDHPEAFTRMAKLERTLEHAILKDENGPVYLDELAPGRGRFEAEKPMSCDLMCRGVLK